MTKSDGTLKRAHAGCHRDPGVEGFTISMPRRTVGPTDSAFEVERQYAPVLDSLTFGIPLTEPAVHDGGAYEELRSRAANATPVATA